MTGSADEVEPPLVVRPDGRGVWIYPLTFGRARIVIGPGPGTFGYGFALDDGW